MSIVVNARVVWNEEWMLGGWWQHLHRVWSPGTAAASEEAVCPLLWPAEERRAGGRGESGLDHPGPRHRERDCCVSKLRNFNRKWRKTPSIKCGAGFLLLYTSRASLYKDVTLSVLRHFNMRHFLLKCLQHRKKPSGKSLKFILFSGTLAPRSSWGRSGDPVQMPGQPPVSLSPHTQSSRWIFGCPWF